MKKTLTLLTITALFGFLAAGCSDNPSETAETGELNLEDEFGGYTASAEPAAFGDQELLSSAEDMEGDEYDDPIMLSPQVDSMMADSVGEFYHLRLLWGQLRYDSSVTTSTDWTGSLSVSNGVEIIRRTIRFELGQDYIPTRTDSSLIEWVSYTTVHNDGIVADIYIPPTDTDQAVTVVFETGPYTRTFSLDELTTLDTIVYLDDADSNAVAMYAFKREAGYCPRGFLSGHWGYDEEGNGVFRGVWMARGGWITGYVSGHYGVNADGNQVFYGKWISANGDFEGLLRGTYDQRPSVNANPRAARRAGGWFYGHIFNADSEEIGVLRGKYRSHPAFRNGFFSGRWKRHCNSGVEQLANIEEGF
jgi:hypothetical protein